MTAKTTAKPAAKVAPTDSATDTPVDTTDVKATAGTPAYTISHFEPVDVDGTLKRHRATDGMGNSVTVTTDNPGEAKQAIEAHFQELHRNLK